MSVLSFLKFSLFLPLVMANVPSELMVPRQTNPTALPGNWSLAGCFTDISTARTLAAVVLVTSNMTVETCIGFCTGAGYIFAGVEFHQECYCDSTIQIPGAKAALTDCNLACAGNPNEICGGPERLSVYASGAPSPLIVPEPSTGWQYQGCLTDSTANRTLPMQINVPIGVTAETCTSACQTAGNFQFAGLENAHECWCGNTTNPIAQHVGNDDCRLVCQVDHDEYCGNANRLALYQFTPDGAPPPPVQECATDLSNFTLKAVFVNPPVGSPSQLSLRAVLVEMVPNVFWTVLSACTSCATEWTTFSIQNSVFLPHSFLDPGITMTSIGPSDGNSPAFVASVPPFPGVPTYCAASTTNPNSPLILSVAGKTNSWSLCSNTTFFNADGRVDLVFNPVTNHPHYAFSSCNAVSVQVIQA
ncbi:hypothetical protein MIND_00989000 [Mycena indigotica]|uniref:WSC domain-containing protein n=1 Tax=Mycena indigotica TaxID=2126181 RepID=A0A8H6S983_9AGAR|nr:uncharacterized protein MIND_00989000 [Mycena indigotica]KAF7294525.1 hypothetical protein MIND_00989000 [Mycena indigotica]